MQRYGKVIKFLGRFFWVIFIVFSVVLVTLYFGIKSYSVQTWAAQKAAESLSKELKAKVTIDGLEIDLFNRLKLRNVFVSDSIQDTLLFAKIIECKLNYFSLSTTTVSIKSMLISDATITLKKYKSPRRNNFDFIVDYFSPRKKLENDTAKSPWKIIPGHLILNNVDFNYLDEKYADRNKAAAINYNYIKTPHFSGVISQIKFSDDSVSADIKNLSAIERSGIVLKKMNTALLFTPKQLIFDSIEIASNDSKYFGRASFDYDNFSDFQDDFEGKVYMRYRIDSSLVYSKDISFYAPELTGMDLSLKLKGDLRGKVDNLKGKNIVFDYGRDTHFDGDISFENLTHTEDLYMHIKANDLTTSKQDLENIPLYPFTEKEKISLPKEIAALGKIKFKGVYDGFIEDFSVKGKAKTDAGSADVNIAIELPNGKTKNMIYDGVIATSDFSISKFLKLPFAIDNISSKINLKGKGLEGKNANIVFEGELLNITYNSYQYKNVKLDGIYNNEILKGKFKSADPNAKFDFDGEIKLNDKIPDMNFIANIENLDLSKLNFIKGKDQYTVSSLVYINMKATSIDDATGRVNFDNTFIKKNDKVYDLSTFDLTTDQTGVLKKLRLNSNFAELNLSGFYNLSNIPNDANYLLSKYLPALTFIDNQKKKIISSDTFSFNCKIKNLNKYTDLYMPELGVAKGSEIKGVYNGISNTCNIKLSSQLLRYGDVKSYAAFATMNTVGDSIVTSFNSSSMRYKDSIGIDSVLLFTSALKDKLNFNLDWNNETNKLNNGKIIGRTTFISNSKFNTEIFSSKIFINDSLWYLDQLALALVDTSSITLSGFNFKNGKHSVTANGVVSKNPNSILNLGLNDFLLDIANPLLKPYGLSINGETSGSANIKNVYTDLNLAAKLDFKKLYFNNEFLGDGILNSIYDKTKNKFELEGYLSRGLMDDKNQLIKNIEFNGAYSPAEKENNFDIDVKLLSISLELINPFVQSLFTVNSGKVAGNVHLSGSPEKPVIEGKLDLQAVKNLLIEYLNTAYSVNGSVTFEKYQIRLDDIVLFDQFGNVGKVYGNLFHEYFRNLTYDIDISTKELMVLNTNASQNKYFYGKAFGTGYTSIYGSPNDVHLDINMKTTAGTQLFLPFDGYKEVDESDYIIFVKKDSTKRLQTIAPSDFGLDLKMQLQATEAAEAQIIFDSRSGDGIKARGDGIINMNIDSKGKFEMYGNYTISNGDYLFTLQDVIRKKFVIDKGSTIKWYGDPYNAEIDVTAIYKQRASLNTLLPPSQTSSTTTTSSTKLTAPVECKMQLKNNLFQPDISFSLTFPTLPENDDKKAQIVSVLRDELELNRQVFSLLLLNSFVTPLKYTGSANADAGISAGGSAGSTASEFLSNQVSNWLGKLNTGLDIGVNYNSSGASSQQVNLALSKQLFDDRLIIDGNVGVNNRAAASGASSFIGDVQLEYKVSEDGRYRVKAFNRTNDIVSNTANGGGQFTQGVGLSLKEEYNTVPELFVVYMERIRKVRKVKQQNSITN
jgi:TamB, inner membrane protein subunit of TAM complex